MIRPKIHTRSLQQRITEQRALFEILAERRALALAHLRALEAKAAATAREPTPAKQSGDPGI